MKAGNRTNGLFDDWWKIGGAAGIAFIVLFIIGAIVLQGDTPMADDSAEEIRSYFADHAKAYLIGDFLTGLAFIFLFLPFASALRSYLGLAEGANGMWSRLSYTGALLMVAIGGATSATNGALAYAHADFADDAILKTLNNMTYYTFTTTFPFAGALLVLPASIVILRTRVLWSWLGWLGLAYSIVAVISSLAVLNRDPNSPLGLLAFMVFIALAIWIIATSVGLLTREPGTSTLGEPRLPGSEGDADA
jgi:hypothetical protein